MPTLEPHQARDIAESFGVDAARYDRARPRYPRELLDAIIAASPGRDVLDVGIGTGILTRQLRAAGCAVTGVEPDARMAEFARRDGTPVEVSTFETWDPAGRTFDAVVAGQTWHWVDPVAGAAKAAEVLRPGGQLALFWNAAQPPAELNSEFIEVYRRIIPDSPVLRAAALPATAPYATMCDTASDGIYRAARFAEPRRHTYEWDRAYTRDEWLEMSATTGMATRLAPDVLTQLLDGLGAAIDAAGGALICRYTTVALTTTRRD
ncbi:class I SAM-dependent methyltransferase [Nocardia pseudobrasiliensis]|uniref:Ubiquinone/menaquinone biosynthesis C-methylase UbiE n=1 Tax=Nocardia pseudobrasiliensis TaxID=45979 RepID=A0A370I281_9NOCA|nr:class I SAM-dependent methyltransferase [Nocardia pseudobrasiliensis]RDI63384.1 ubiquinone/menaquinone biosynthesis C-methylase UbiE [Nocardia pseudobrasiliensis]